MTKNIMRLARNVKPIRVGLSDGGELKDPTKRAAFMNLFTPRAAEANLPATIQASAPAPMPQQMPSSGPASAENPDLIAQATKTLMEAPVTRRKFLETSRNAVAAANQAKNINKLLKPKKFAKPPMSDEAKQFIARSLLTERVNTDHPAVKGLFNYAEELYPELDEFIDNRPDDEMDQFDLHSHLMEENPRRMIDLIHGGGNHVSYMQPDLEDEIYNRARHHFKSEFEKISGEKISDEELKKLISEAEENYSGQGNFHDEQEPEHKAFGGPVGMNVTGTMLPPVSTVPQNNAPTSSVGGNAISPIPLVTSMNPTASTAATTTAAKADGGRIGKDGGGSLSERRAAAQAKIKELSAQLRNHAPGTPEHESLKQAIKDQGQIVAQKGEAPPPQKVVGIGHNNPPEETPIRVTNKLGTYSHAAEVAEKANVDKMSPSEWVKYLGNQKGVKEEELRWANIEGMTPEPGKKSVSRQAVARRLEDANLEDYTENVRSYKYYKDATGAPLGRQEQARAVASDALKDPELFKKIYGEDPDVDQDLHYAEEDLKSQGYKNELLHQALADHLASNHYYGISKYLRSVEPRHEQFSLKGRGKNDNYREIVAQYKPDHPLYKYDTHYPEDNPLFHVRLTDLHTPEGKKLLHVEEVQGDWGQQGRGKFSPDASKKGELRKKFEQLDNDYDEANGDFRSARDEFHEKLEAPLMQHSRDFEKLVYDKDGDYTEFWRNLPTEQRRTLRNEHQKQTDALNRELNDKISTHEANNYENTEVESFAKRKKELANLRSNAWGEYHKVKDLIPEGPHVTDTDKWTKLAVKRVLKEAAEGGYHGIVLTPGSEQSKRWQGQPGVQQYYDETLQPMLEKELKSHDPEAGQSSNPYTIKTTKKITNLDHEAVADMLGMPAPTNDTERYDVASAWTRTPNQGQLRREWEASGKNMRTTETPLPTYDMTPKAAASIPNNQRLFKRGGDVRAPVAKSRNMIHNPAIIGLALNKIRSLPREDDQTPSGKQGRLF